MITIVLLLGIYFSVLLFIGFRSRNKYNIQDFFLGNRDINSFSLSISLVATVIGSSATIGIIGLASKVGLPAIWWLLSGIIGLFVLRFFVVDRIFLLGARTISDIFRIFYSKRIEILASILIVISWTGVIAGQIIATAKLINIYFNFHNLILLKMIFLSIVIIYVFLGGQKAVIRTDIFQFFVIFPAFILLFYFLGTSVDNNLINKEFLKFPYNNLFVFKKVVSFVLVLFPMYLIGPDIYSRFLTVKNKNVVKKSLLIAIILLFCFAIIITFIGIFGNAILNISGEALAFDLIKMNFNKIISFLILFGFLSAFLSSADTCFFTASSILAMNIFRSRKVLYNKFILVSYAGLVFIITIKFSSILDALMFGYKIFVSGLFVPFIMPLLFKKYKFFEFSAILNIIWAILINFILFYLGNNNSLFIFINLLGSIVIFILTNIIISLKRKKIKLSK